MCVTTVVDEEEAVHLGGSEGRGRCGRGTKEEREGENKVMIF